MRLTILLPPALLALATAATPTSPSPNTAAVARRINLESVFRGKRFISPRHGDAEHEMTETAPAHPPSAQHNHLSSHWIPLREINETVILETHDPDPWSFYDQDTSAEGGYPGVLLVHVALMSLAFFILLPVGELAESRLLKCSEADFARLHSALPESWGLPTRSREPGWLSRGVGARHGIWRKLQGPEHGSLPRIESL